MKFVTFIGRILSPTVILAALLSASVSAQSTASIQGRVVDQAGAVVAGALVTARHQATGLERFATSDDDGSYLIAALPVGVYQLRIQAPGFQSQVVASLVVEVARSVVQDFELHVGDISQQAVVISAPNLVERTTISVGHVMDKRMVQEIPLNGRYFLDLGLLGTGGGLDRVCDF